LLNRFSIAETTSFVKMISAPAYRKMYGKICDYIYPQLQVNPYFGPNIKRLKGNFSNVYRFRIGDYRLFYKIDSGKVIIYIIDIRHRKNAYE
jgi:mRNA interferase RelE/StbE